MDPTFDPLEASNDEIISWCNTAKFLHGGTCFEGLILLSSNVIVKVGMSVTEQEARNQTFAYDQLKATNLKVPRVHRFFSHQVDHIRRGYLIMEYIPGKTMEECMVDCKPEEKRKHAQNIYNAISLLSSIPAPSQAPGPIGGGECSGYLFDPDKFGSDTAEFESTQQLNDWMNIRLNMARDPSSKASKIIVVYKQAQTGNLAFQDTDLVFTHGDTSPRNFIIGENNELTLVDWAYAGFFPRDFEIFNCWARASWDPLLQDVYELFRGSEVSHVLWKLRCVLEVNFICPPYVKRIPPENQDLVMLV